MFGNGRTTDSLLVEWKLTDSYFCGLFFLKYAASNNQRDFFLDCLLDLRISPIKICQLRVTANSLRNKGKFFFECFIFFPRAWFWSTKQKYMVGY